MLSNFASILRLCWTLVDTILARDTAGQVKMLRALAKVAQSRPLACRLLERGLRLAEAAGKPMLAGLCRADLAAVLLNADDRAAARALLAGGLPAVQACGPTLDQAQLALTLGTWCLVAGDLALANQLCALSVETAEAQGAMELAARAVNQCGLVAYVRQEYAQARALFEDAWNRFRCLGLEAEAGRARVNWELSVIQDTYAAVRHVPAEPQSQLTGSFHIRAVNVTGGLDPKTYYSISEGDMVTHVAPPGCKLMLFRQGEAEALGMWDTLTLQKSTGLLAPGERPANLFALWPLAEPQAG